VMKMRIVVAVISLVVITWAATASAQSTTYSVAVSVHRSLPPLSDDEINDILDKASKLLQKPGQADADDDAQCNVTFTLKGPVHIFDSPGPTVDGNMDIEPMHLVNSNRLNSNDVHFIVKVVKEILHCRGCDDQFHGCAYPPDFRSIIVVHPAFHKDSCGQPISDFPNHVLWAHEFGHLTGLPHRTGTHALMTSRPVTGDSVRVNREECRCLRGGLRSCQLPPTPISCQSPPIPISCPR
jgi:hypothetical protein